MGTAGAMTAAGLLLAGLAGGAVGDELTPVRAFRAFNRTTAPDLPESIVVDLLQDREGVLWIDTIGGLATYDGSAVRAERDPEAPRGVSLLAERQAGGLYALSRRGFHVYDGRWRRVASQEPVRSVAEAGEWLWAVRGEDVWRTRTDAVGSSWERVAIPGGGNVRSLASDRKGGVYVFERDRILRCREAACAAVPASGRRPERAATALAARDGSLWLATWDGRLLVAREGAADWSAIDLGPWPSGGVRSLAEDRDGAIWVGGMARLCHGAAGGPWSCWGVENGLPNTAILSLLADREGTLWLGLNGSGLLQWVGQPWTHRTRWPGDPASSGLDVTSLAPTSDGGLLASVFGRGILRWDGRALTAWGTADGLTEDVRTTLEPSPGVVWAAARHGVFERERGGRFRRTLALANGFASGFARDPSGSWHVFTEDHGVFRRTSTGGWERALDLEALAAGRRVNGLVWTEAGDLWVTTRLELVVRSPSGAITRHALGLENGLTDTVATILWVGPDEVWVGGSGGVAVGKGGRWRVLPETDGVPGNVYFLRRAPDGAIWAGGSRGIARVRDGRWTRWDHTSGLVGDECNGGALVRADGSLLAATSGSLARFDPRTPARPEPPLAVHWRAPDDAVGAAAIRRPADERRLVLAWSAPWLAPEPVEYATRIGGASWSAPTRATEMTIESLPAGVSEVAVRARRGPNDAWSAPASLRVTVAPHPWETTGARVAAALAAAGLMLLLAHGNARRLHARRERALARMRTDFMASASHELRTPIAQIRLFGDMLRLGRSRTEGERAEALQTIHRATVRLETLARNLMRLARGEAQPSAPAPSCTSIAELLHSLAREMAPFAEARAATLEVDVEPELSGVVDAEGLRMAVANLVENALKYGPAGQVVRLEAERTADGVILVVEDEGPGIPVEDRERVWERFARLDRDRNSAVGGTGLGLAVVRETVEQAGGSARIEDATPNGTRVVLRLPQPEVETSEATAARAGAAP